MAGEVVELDLESPECTPSVRRWARKARWRRWRARQVVRFWDWLGRLFRTDRIWAHYCQFCGQPVSWRAPACPEGPDPRGEYVPNRWCPAFHDPSTLDFCWCHK